MELFKNLTQQPPNTEKTTIGVPFNPCRPVNPAVAENVIKNKE